MKHTTSFMDCLKETWQSDDEAKQEFIITISSLLVIVFAIGFWIGQVMI